MIIPFRHVVAGVIPGKNNDIFLAKRPAHVHQGGLWEFPGGKKEANETVEEALARELAEEIDLQVKQARPLINIDYHYPDKHILLDVWLIEKWTGHPWGKEGQVVEWCAIKDLNQKQFPLANYPITQAVQLPDTYLITPEPYQAKTFFYQFEICLDHGIQLVQLRAKQLDEKAYCLYAEKALRLCQRYHARLLVNATPKIALTVGADGVHLTSQQLKLCTERPLSSGLLVAASCHHQTEIQQANTIQTNFIVLSPVRTTNSHPNTQSMGWQQFFTGTQQAHCPVFALGGMQRNDLPQVWAHCGQGIAGISHLWERVSLENKVIPVAKSAKK